VKWSSSMRRLFCLILLLAIACDREWRAPFEPPLDGLIAYYPFNGNANDASGNGYHGTLVSASANGSLIIGNNTSDRLIIPSAVLHGRSDFTILANVKITTLHTESANWSWNTLISGATASNDNNFYFGYKGDQRCWGYGHRDITYYFPRDQANWAQRWHLVALQRRGAYAQLLIDGEPIGSGLTVNSTPLTIDISGLVVGQEQDSVGGSFDIRQSFWGEIDDLLFYDRALSEEEIEVIKKDNRWN